MQFFDRRFSGSTNIKNKQHQYFKKIVGSERVDPLPVNTNGLQTQFIKENEDFKLLVNKIETFNSNIPYLLRNAELDLWRDYYYNTISNCLHDIAALDNRDLQIKQLEQLRIWSDSKDVELRQKTQDPGKVRYKNYLTQRKKALLTPAISQSGNQTMKDQESTRIQRDYQEQAQLPTNVRKQLLSQYDKGTRTIHPQIGPPEERLQQYKRKQLSMVIPKMSMRKIKQIKKQRLRALYPKPMKQQKQVQEQNKQEEGQKQIKKEQEGPRDEDLGLGIEDQGIDEQPIQQPKQDRLAPKRKPYIQPVADPQYVDKKDVEIRGNFKHFNPDQGVGEREMEERRYANAMKELQYKKQDQEVAQIMQKWAAKKARTEKQLQRRLQIKKFVPNSTTIEEKPSTPELFSMQDQRKYFPLSERLKNQKRQSKFIDTSVYLPKINTQAVQKGPIRDFEKSLGRAKVHSLKKDYADILNLNMQPFQRDPLIPKSLCQQTKRNKSFSEVLEDYSLNSQRESQYEEVKKMKQRLAKYKVPLNVKLLSQGICIPNCQIQQKSMPQPNLLSNPFMQVAKKKKKKKKK